MAKETIELSFLVDVAAFEINLPSSLSLEVGDDTLSYPVENNATYDVAVSEELEDKVTAEVITDANENKFLQVKVVATTVESKLTGSITVTPNGESASQIAVELASNVTPVQPEPQPEVPEPQPEVPEVEKPNIDDDTDIPDDNSLFLKFVGVEAGQKIELKKGRNKILYFKTNGDKYTVATAVEGNVTVQTVEEIAKQKGENPYKVVKLKVTGVSESSDVKISVQAERGKDDTELTANETISVEKDKTVKLDVTTNADSFNYEVTPNDGTIINVEQVEGGLNITGVAEGTATIVIKATAEGCNESSVTVTVTVTAAAAAPSKPDASEGEDGESQTE